MSTGNTTLDVANVPWVARLRAVAERIWDRIDRMVLRLQGRVDTPGWDRGLPYAIALLLGAILVTITLARNHSLLLGEETAKYAQATWQIADGLRPVTSLSDGHVIAEQGSLILYPLGLLTAVLPRIETLLILKAVALAVTVVPLWRLARSHGRLGIGASSVVVFGYSIYTAVHAMNAADFAPAILAVPALMWAVLYGFDERERLMVVAVVFALCCRADLGIAIAGLGVLLALEGRRRMGVISMLLGAGWFLLSMYGLQPWLNGGSYEFLAPYAEFGETPLRALWGIITHPVRFLQVVGSVANFQVLVSLFAPVLFLPLTAPRYVMPALPLYIFYMGADVEAGRLREAAQTVPITVFVFVATVFALQRAGRTLVKRVRVERRIILALMLTSIVFFVRDSPSSPYNEPWEWGQRDEIDEARLAAVAELPGINEPVRASASILPLLSERLGVYLLDTRGPDSVPDKVAAATARVDWILLDRDDEIDETDENALSSVDVGSFRTQLAQRGWNRVEFDDPSVEIYHFTGVIAPELAVQLESVADSDDGG